MIIAVEGVSYVTDLLINLKLSETKAKPELEKITGVFLSPRRQVIVQTTNDTGYSRYHFAGNHEIGCLANQFQCVKLFDLLPQEK